VAGWRPGARCRGGDGGFLPLPVGLAVQDQLPGGGLEPVDGGLASSGSAISAIHSAGSRLEVVMVAAARCRSTMIS
jgi:hypothetical protein